MCWLVDVKLNLYAYPSPPSHPLQSDEDKTLKDELDALMETIKVPPLSPLPPSSNLSLPLQSLPSIVRVFLLCWRVTKRVCPGSHALEVTWLTLGTVAMR
jgi:hypothetical protein